MSRAVLVLGAGGFIGRRVAAALARDGAQVVAATRRPCRFTDPRISNVTSPFLQPEHFTPLLANVDAVVHSASSSTPASSEAHPLLELEDNLRPTLALIESMQSRPGCRLVYLSSGGTLYGDRSSEDPHEDDALRPRSYHGAGKAAAEVFLHAWAEQYGTTAVILRPSNVYGPGQTARPGFGLIATALSCAATGSEITVWGDGGAVRDYLHVDDLVSLCTSAITAPLASGTHVFNASTGAGITIRALLDLVERVTGRPLHRRSAPGRRVDLRHVVPDNRRARALLGWSPTYSLAEGLEDTWRWFLSAQ